jgi:hypothetical protein
MPTLLIVHLPEDLWAIAHPLLRFLRTRVWESESEVECVNASRRELTSVQPIPGTLTS